MRNLIYAINLTADGCCDHTKIGGSDEMLEFCLDLFRDVDLQIFGRKTYELMVPYWPDVANDPTDTEASIAFAKAFIALNRIVFSRTLKSVEEKNTNIVRSNLKDDVLKLKQQPGKKILLGGVSVPEQLIELGLVDEFYFVVHPIVAGEGRRLGEGVSLPERLNLKLVDAKTLKSGVVVLHYLKQ
jgi:dihydrofolate reductase